MRRGMRRRRMSTKLPYLAEKEVNSIHPPIHGFLEPLPWHALLPFISWYLATVGISSTTWIES